MIGRRADTGGIQRSAKGGFAADTRAVLAMLKVWCDAMRLYASRFGYLDGRKRREAVIDT